MAPASVPAPPAPTRPRQAAATGSYHELSAQVREAGLLDRTPGFYFSLLAALTTALAGLVAGFVLLGHSWFQLLIAAGLGLVLTQFAFVAHEASHRQVLLTGPANDRLGRILANGVVGISHSWWMTKHTRHHANPNRVGKDPDIEWDTVSFLEEDAAKQRGLMAAITRRQGWLFFPLLTLEGVNLHILAFKSLLASPRSRARTLELVILTARLGIYVALVVWALPLGMAAAFLAVQLAVFGVYMGASFAPNHKGMAIIPADSRLDFLSKQVLTSRNIGGGTTVTMLMGGLDAQIEHHLFPSMPRPHLARARRMVREHCAQVGMPYTETSLVRSYLLVVQYLNRVGLSARDPFDCPMVQRYRARSTR
ncbi:acyl-CoA desaturase [Cellulomonas sp. zg-ZUI222]|uniref:Acyl-CoA desaturase n=1 Tax=Cellulomonas wangleii TaxID=2816956 RepID=A0ABX8D3J5_9CELL|nr:MULTISPECIES: acyl-CoA desaturase [Cellulomonas]MBO0900066.1 acyl-CoA desaturase [Cellulomonas sp. zg-ZUI22]MBO0921019.1 acyl-CoA desaturase [Cellulomonas wangleii]MBO0925499.1 acyl-CoA desaturase [Cellulomonas wangleii]QVI61031.1 acyl-CoA desaturase [Cellulomonas wangleii]